MKKGTYFVYTRLGFEWLCSAAIVKFCTTNRLFAYLDLLKFKKQFKSNARLKLHQE